MADVSGRTVTVALIGALGVIIAAWISSRGPADDPDARRIQSQAVRVESPAPTIAAAANAPPPPTPSPLSMSDLVGRWILELATEQGGRFNFIAQLEADGKFSIWPPNAQDATYSFAIKPDVTQWTLRPTNEVAFSFKTRIYSDRLGIAIGESRPFVDAFCTLQVPSLSVMDGRCVDGRGATRLRLSR